MNIIDLGLKFRKEQLSGGNTPRALYLHHTAGIRTVQEYHQQHLNKGWAGLGYNFAVDLDGKVYKGRDAQYIPAGVLGHNKDSLHIVAIGNFENMVMPEVQKKSVLEIVAYVKNTYPTITIIKGHKEAMATDCPGRNYPLNEVKLAFVNGVAPNHTPVETPSAINAKIFKLQHTLNEIGIADSQGNKLREDGWIGPKTLSALAKSAALVKRGDRNKLVGWIQEQLKITVDNSYGRAPYHETYDAICAFQRARGLVVDGKIGIKTWSELVK